LSQRFRKGGPVADEAQLNAVLMQPLDLSIQGRQEQLHQDGNFLLWPTPVLAAESKQSKCLHTLTDTVFHRPADRPHTSSMSSGARQQTLLSPPSIAIHDDRDMSGESILTRR
jgi:hypothetical protein